MKRRREAKARGRPWMCRQDGLPSVSTPWKSLLPPSWFVSIDPMLGLYLHRRNGLAFVAPLDATSLYSKWRIRDGQAPGMEQIMHMDLVVRGYTGVTYQQDCSIAGRGALPLGQRTGQQEIMRRRRRTTTTERTQATRTRQQSRPDQQRETQATDAEVGQKQSRVPRGSPSRRPHAASPRTGDSTSATAAVRL